MQRRDFNSRPWTKEEDALLGTDIDSAVARRLGVAKSSVAIRRQILGISTYQESLRGRKVEARPSPLPAEAWPLLGTIPDLEIARRYALSTYLVRQCRRKLGIASFSGVGAKPKHQWTEETEKLLGTLPDQKVADRLSIPVSSVAAKRYALGIPSCKMRNRPRAAHLIPFDGQKVRARRLALGLTYEATSGGNATHKSHLAKMEKGIITSVTQKTMRWLCEVLQCQPDDIA